MKNRALSILFLLAALTAVAAAQTPRGALRVMTFNIRYDEPRDGVNAWPNRQTKVADVIRFHKADLIGVQEALHGQLRDLEKLLPGFEWCGVGREGGQKGEFSAVLFRRARFRLLATDTFWLSETPRAVGSKGWDANLPRIVTWARLRDRETGRTFYVFNTHFDHQGPRARLESAKLLRARIPEIAAREPFVVTGDFNANEKTDVYRTLTAGDGVSGEFRLIDARTVSANGHFGGNSTFSGFGALRPDYKIDHIFVGDGTRVLEHGVLADQWDGLWASDHLPVLAEIVPAARRR